MVCEVYDAEAFRKSGHQLVDFLADQLTAMKSGLNEKTLPWADQNEVLDEVDGWASLESGELFEQVFQRCIRLHDPRYMGHQLMPPAPVTALAGMFTEFMNNGMGVYEMGPAGSAIEHWLMKKVATEFGLGEAADGFMTHGGTLANLTGMLAARAAHCPDAWQTGKPDNLAVMVSEQAHYCMDRAARVMGWGADGVIGVPCDEEYRMRTDLLGAELEKARSAGKRVIAVCGTACTTSTGSVDDLRAIGQFCSQHDLWFHVDGAHGAAVAFSDKYRSLVDGMELADSIGMDFHKMLLAPAVTSAVLFKKGNDAYRTFAQDADYLLRNDGDEDPWHDVARRTFECTKTMLGLKVFSIVANHGWQVFDAAVTQLIDLASCFADQVEATEDFELALRPQANILCFRHVGGDGDLNEVNAGIRKSLIEEGQFYIVQTVLDGETWLRTTITNPVSTPEHFSELLEHIRKLV
jgi:L-2,4-diaminobutyrate decarboxylase